MGQSDSAQIMVLTQLQTGKTVKIKPVAFRIGVLTTTAKPLAGQRTTLFTLKIINLE